jgi:pimeloyl-ACP methyl ester carboxylesterase
VANLQGAPVPIEIAPGGYSIEAPGVHGTVAEISSGPAATRGEGGLFEDQLQRAALAADMVQVKDFAIDVTRVDTSAGATRAGGEVRTPEGEPAMVLRVPALDTNVAQLVLHTDEAGVSRWIFPSPATRAQGATRGGIGEVEFLLPRDSAPPATSEAGPGTRGQLTKLGRRLVRVLAWATEDVIGKGAMYVASRWEGSRRPYALRRFPLNDSRPIEWSSLQQERSLLLIHGTFSTASSAFEGLPPTTIDSLRQLYGDRMFVFDHPTLHQTPVENVEQFFAMLPPGARLDLDIVTHSRGGLVGRELTERYGDYTAHGRTINVRRAIFVAAPQRGTVLTDTQHGIQMLDRYTNLFTDLPDNSFTLSMEGVFMLAKLVYHGAVSTLPGLRSMFPSGDYLQRLNLRPAHDTEYYALGADYRPAAPSMLTRFGWSVLDRAVDGIFGEANDVVVPTSGSYELQSSVDGFPIETARRTVFGQSDGIHHCNYFGSPKVSKCLIDWLGAA